MICKYCNKEIDEGSVFCTYCGKKTSEESIIEVLEEQKEVLEEQEEVVEEQEKVLEEQEEVNNSEDEEGNSEEVSDEEDTETKEDKSEEVNAIIPEEDKTNYPSDIYSNEFEYTKTIFNRYYKQEFIQRSLASYIVIQILLLGFFTFPGVLFALIFWLISNPITKSSVWRGIIHENKGNQPIYRFFFTETELIVKENMDRKKRNLIVRRNRCEECCIEYNKFKKIIMNNKGILFLSKKRDFYLPLEYVKNIDEIKEILSTVKKAKIKIKH